MAPSRVGIKHRPMGVKPDGVVQAFVVPNFINSYKILPTVSRRHDGFVSVRVGTIKREFKGYDHIEREAPPNDVVPTVAQAYV